MALRKQLIELELEMDRLQKRLTLKGLGTLYLCPVSTPIYTKNQNDVVISK